MTMARLAMTRYSTEYDPVFKGLRLMIKRKKGSIIMGKYTQFYTYFTVVFDKDEGMPDDRMIPAD